MGVAQNREVELPALYENIEDGVVILVTSKSSNGLGGVIVHEPSYTYGVGYYCEAWYEGKFKPFNGQIILDGN